jgi:hypothetical protein
VPVAELPPITEPQAMAADKKAKIFDSMKEIWARLPQANERTRIIKEDRKR